MTTPETASRWLRSLSIATLLGASSTLGAQPVGAQPAAASAPQTPARDAAVLARLGEVGSHLRTLKQFSVRADATTDEVLETGQKIQFSSQVEYQVSGASLLRASVRSDRVHRDYYFNGKTLTQVAPRAGYYASVALPGTIAEALPVVAQQYGIDIPLADLFLWGTPKAGMEDVTAATRVGPAKIGGVDCDHFALRQQGVDWQVWVMRGSKPLPLKMVITTTDEPSQPQYAALLHWNVKAAAPAQSFTYTPAKGVHRIELKPVVASK